MVVSKLIALLQKLPADAEVLMFDGDVEGYEPVTGAVHNGDTIELTTDSHDGF